MAEATQKITPPTMSEERQAIIQCPGCQTKFLVASSALRDVDFPRFHCSRCDNLFSLDVKTIAGESTELAHDEAPAAAEPTMSETAPVSVTPPPPPLIDDFAPIPGSSIDQFTLEPPPPPPLTARVGPVAGHRGLEIPKGLTGDQRATSPHEHRADIEENQIAFDFIASSVPSDRLFDDGDTAPRSSKNHTPTATASLPAIRWGVSGWRGSMALAAPIVGCLVVLGIFAVGLSSQGALSEPFMAQLFPAAARIAPPELRLIDTSFEKLALSNGETIHLITGTVRNESSSDLRHVVIEGLAFDAAGNQLAAVRANSGGTLAESRLQSLTPDIIAALQNGPNAKPLTVKAGESEKVAVALLDTAATEARFFSARVFSVR